MAKQTISTLNIKVTASAEGVRKGIGKAKTGMGGLTDATKKAGAALKRLAVGGIALGAAAVGWGIKLAADAETARVSFEVLTGSAKVAKKTLEDIRSFAASTPFQTKDLTAAAQKLLAFGTAAEDVVGTLRMIGDVSAGIGAPIGEIAEIYGKARVQGRLFMEDINQLTGRGIPIIGELAKQFGVTESEVRDLVSSGKVNFSHLEEAFRSMTATGGQFFELTKKQSETLSGKWSTLKDNAALLAMQVGEVLVPALTKFIDSATKTVAWLKNMDMETVKNTATVVAMASAFGVALAIIPKVIAAGKALITMFRAIATSQSIILALGGPAGLATLAVGLVAAAAAGVAVHAAFDRIGESVKTADDKIKDVAGSIRDTAKAASDTADVIADIKFGMDEAFDPDKLTRLKDELSNLKDIEGPQFSQGTTFGGIRGTSGASSAIRQAIVNRQNELAEARKRAEEQARRDKERDRILNEISEHLGRPREPITVRETTIVG